MNQTNLKEKYSVKVLTGQDESMLYFNANGIFWNRYMNWLLKYTS